MGGTSLLAVSSHNPPPKWGTTLTTRALDEGEPKSLGGEALVEGERRERERRRVSTEGRERWEKGDGREGWEKGEREREMLW